MLSIRSRRSTTTAARRQTGQAAVETAIVMPLMVFLVLGLLQMNLVYQARMVAEYAAYKAVRNGALNNANKTAMRNAAISALLPTISNPMPGEIASVGKSSTGMKWVEKYLFATLLGGKYMSTPFMDIVEVEICNPSTEIIPDSDLIDGKELDFDDPAASSLVTTGSRSQNSVDKLRRGRLSIQLTYNYNMPIPFANWVIWQIQNGSHIVDTLRLKPKPRFGLPEIPKIDKYYMAGSDFNPMKQYYMPIRVDYSMRMQSNLFVKSTDSNYKLPTEHGGECKSYRSNES